MNEYNINNVKGEIVRELAKRIDRTAVRGKWAAYWGTAKPMDAEIEAKIATLGNYKRHDCDETVRDNRVAREIAAKIAAEIAA